MDIKQEINKVYVLMQNSAETLEDVLQKSYEIPVDNWSKEKPPICFPDSEDALQNLLELIAKIDKNIDQVKTNIRQFQLNKFQVIKEEEFDPRLSQPLIDYEIVQNAEQAHMNRMKSNVIILIKILMNNQLGVLLLLDAPPNLQFGIDNSQWIVGKKFKGIQGIPYGTHYVHYCTKDENYQFKQGFFFIVTQENRILVKQWNEELQEFLSVKDYMPYIHAVQMGDFDVYLGIYPNEKFDLWKQCVQMINKKVLDKLDPIKNACIEEYNDQDLGSNQPLHTTIYYTDIPKNKNPNKSIGQELTSLNFDKSSILEELLKKEYQNDYSILLGELQYSFVKFLLGEHFESFEQWKQLLLLITSCERLINEQTQLFIEFIPIFYHQLQQLPNDFFIDPISQNSFIQSCIKNIFELFYYENNEQNQIRLKLNGRCDKLKELVNKRFIGYVDKGDDEDEPIVVEDFNFVQI